MTDPGKRKGSSLPDSPHLVVYKPTNIIQNRSCPVIDKTTLDTDDCYMCLLIDEIAPNIEDCSNFF